MNKEQLIEKLKEFIEQNIYYNCGDIRYIYEDDLLEFIDKLET